MGLRYELKANSFHAEIYDMARTQNRHQWLEPVENVDRRNLLWERILSGVRASKVLAP